MLIQLLEEPFATCRRLAALEVRSAPRLSALPSSMRLGYTKLPSSTLSLPSTGTAPHTEVYTVRAQHYARTVNCSAFTAVLPNKTYQMEYTKLGMILVVRTFFRFSKTRGDRVEPWPELMLGSWLGLGRRLLVICKNNTAKPT